MTHIERARKRIAELTAFLELCDKATPGPWYPSGEWDASNAGLNFSGIYFKPEDGDERHIFEEGVDSRREYDDSLLNAAFIAAARNLSPDMARRERELLEWAVEFMHQIYGETFNACAAYIIDTLAPEVQPE